MPFYAIDTLRPVVDPSAYVHPSAVVIGDVWIGPKVYVGPCACLRGDFGRLILKEGSNLQDTCVMHGFPEMDTVVEENGHIGHGAVLHGCTIGKNAMVGMNAVVMDGCEIGEYSIVAATAFVKAGERMPGRSLIIGSPARVKRPLSEEEIDWKFRGTALYQQLAERSQHTLVETTPLEHADENRQRITLKASPLHLARTLTADAEK